MNGMSKKNLVKHYVLEQLHNYVENNIDDIVDLETGELKSEYYNFESFMLDEEKIKNILGK